jgi:ABC-type branched-subunit amino acid transport system ATPase component
MRGGTMIQLGVFEAIRKMNMAGIAILLVEQKAVKPAYLR